MPKIGNENDNDAEMQMHQLAGGNFSFTAQRLDRLGATEYTLVTIVVDVTGSTSGFEDALHTSLVTAIKSCKKSPRSENLLVRVVIFSSVYGVQEIHGFKPLSDINPDTDYKPFRPSGGTPLFDAVYSAIAATKEYGKQLRDSDYSCNAIIFIITDGDDTSSSMTPNMIRQETEGIKASEKLESCVTVLIGVNVQGQSGQHPGKTMGQVLEDFRNEASITSYIDAGSATAGKFAKLAQFVSQSVSSQSQSLGSGGPSQNIAPTI